MKKTTLLLIAFLISCYSYSQLPTEDFEGTWPITGWTIYDNGTGTTESWMQSEDGNPFQLPYEGTYAAFIENEDVPDGGSIPQDWLVTPQFTLPLNALLEFYSSLTIGGDNGGLYRIMISSDPDPSNLAAYEEVIEWTELEINPSQTEYNEIQVSLPADLAGTQVYIAFVMEGDNADRWLVDYVSVNQQCLMPENLNAANITLTSAELSWDEMNGTTEWEIEVIEATDVPTFSGDVYDEALPYPVTDLEPGTDYKFYVRAICGPGLESGWAGPFMFSTSGYGDTCENPIAVTSLPYSDTDNTSNYANMYAGAAGTGCGTLFWEEYLNGNDVVYQYTAGFTGEVSINVTNMAEFAGVFVYESCANIGTECIAGATSGFGGNSASIPSVAVTSGQSYYIVISTSFGNPVTPYTLAIQQVNCEPPAGLPVVADMTSVELSWTNPTAATSWEVVVQEPGLGLPAGAGEPATTNTDFLVDELTPATLYEYYIRSDCGDGTFSAWAGPYQFNTLICEAVAQCEYTFILTDLAGDGWNENTMSVMQNGITLAVLGEGFDFGAGPIEVTVPVCHNIPLQLFWNDGGFSEDQVGVSIKNSFDQTVYSKAPGEGVQNSLLYEGDVDCNTISCLPPFEVTATNNTLTSVQLGWEGAATGDWEYYVVEESEPAPDDSTPGISVTTNPVTINDLNPATNYDFYIRMICDGAATPESVWGGPHQFSTQSCAEADKCDYIFTMTAESGGYAGNTMTITQGGIYVTTIGSTFTEGSSQSVTVPLCDDLPVEVYWNFGGNPYSIGLIVTNPYEQTVYTLIQGEEIQGAIIYDGVIECDNPACIPPIDLTAENAAMTTIDLGWEGLPDGSWEYYITEAGNPAPTPDTDGEATATNPVTATGLTSSTNYEYYVRVVCEGGTYSAWAGPFAFNTTVCQPEDKCIHYFELTSALGWGWENTTMTVFQGGVPIATLGPGFGFGSSYIVEIPLCPDVEVEVFWNNDGWGNPADKGLNIYTTYMESFFEMAPGSGEQGTTIFTGTPSCDVPPCPKPQDLTAGDITLTTAVLGWSEMGSATEWEVAVLPSGSPEPTEPGNIVDETIFTAEGLNSGSAYVFYVRANCGDENGYSTWSGPFLFATPLENDDCINAIPVPVNEGGTCDEYVSGILNGSTSSGVQSACAWAVPNNDVWYSFQATNERHNISISNQTGESFPMRAIYTGGCDGLVEVSCNWEMNANVLWDLTIGETYYIQVYLDPGSPEPSSITSFDLCIYTPTAVSLIIDKEEYTAEEIVTDILIDSNCGSVSNITSSTGVDFGIPSNGIAYFNQGATDFPIQEGIVLTSTDAGQVRGPNVTTMGNGAIGGDIDYWPGDDQLLAYLQGSGLPSISTLQASILEFDFVPVTDRIKFPFIFASEEYNGSDQCYRSDAFAFFLTHPDGSITNLAVVPGTTVPVSSMSIRDEAYLDPNFEFSCDSQNPEYFGNYYGPFNGLDPMMSPTNFNGHTVMMYAEADVVPGQTYHIKLVVADEFTSGLDSAVFIGPFDIGNVDIGIDLTVENGSALCAGEEFTIDSGLDEELYEITWLQDGEVMDGETGSAITVTEAGEYTIEVQYLTTTCGGSDSVVIEYHESIEDVTQEPVDLTACMAGDTAQFDLAQNNELILAGANPEDFVITYHLSQEDADNEEGSLESPYENTSNPQPIYVRVQHATGDCYIVYSFNLIVSPQYVADMLPDVEECDSYTLPELSAGNNYYTGENGTGEMLNAGDVITTFQVIYIYAQSVTEPGCADQSSFTVTINPTPSFSLGDAIAVCDPSFAIIEVMPDNFDTAAAVYEWTLDGVAIPGDGPILEAIDYGTYEVTVTIGECSHTESVEVTEDTDAVLFNLTHGCEGTVYMLNVIPRDGSFDTETADISWSGPNGFNTSDATVEIEDEGIYTVTVITPEGCIGEGSVQVNATGCLIPRGISPNGDGKNDSFNLEGLGVTKLSVFNRYGQEVYGFNGNYTDQWHGQSGNGNELPTGTYFYSIDRTGGISKTGWVYINRQEN